MNHSTQERRLVSRVTPLRKRVGRFIVEREIGRGAVGTIYLAHDPLIDRPVAIKTFNSSIPLRKRQEMEEQFINEARAAGRLSHPNIITIYEASGSADGAYIAMEYLKGKPLNEMLDNQYPFKFTDIAKMMWKITDALALAHEHGVVHRDIKPANIYMVNEKVPTLIDFGIARSPNRLADQSKVEEDNPYTMHRAGLTLGTPNYMSPEQAKGGAGDARSDIYSVGAILYEMATGQKPFAAVDLDSLLSLIAHKAPRLAQEVNPKIPAILATIIARAMAKSPDKRYQTANALRDDLYIYLSNHKRAAREGVAVMPRAQNARSTDGTTFFGWLVDSITPVSARKKKDNMNTVLQQRAN